MGELAKPCTVTVSGKRKLVRLTGSNPVTVPMIVNVIHSAARCYKIDPDGSVIPDRYELIHLEAYNQGFEIKFWPAIFSSKPARGISLAHRQIVSWAKENNLPWVIILEDDCHFTSPGAFDFWISKMPDDFDLYLGGLYVLKKMNVDGSIRDFSGLHCYIAHSRFYDQFLSVNPDKNLDSALWGLGKYVLCDPLVSIQWETYSDHHKEVLNNEELLDGRPRFFGGRSFY